MLYLITLNITYSNLPFSFGVDDKGRYGYIKAGADTVTPFKISGAVTIHVGFYHTAQLAFETGHTGYNNFVANIDLAVYTRKGNVDYYGIDIKTTYDKNTGRIMVTGTGNEPAFASFVWERDYTLKYVFWND